MAMFDTPHKGGDCRSSPVSSSQSEDLATTNQMIIWQLQQRGLLDQGRVEVLPDGQLKIVNLADDDQDYGTFIGMYPSESAREDIKPQIPSWLRNQLVDELRAVGSAPPKAFHNLHGFLRDSQEDMGINLTVDSARDMISLGCASLERSLDDVRLFVKMPTAVDELYAMDVQRLEMAIRELAGHGRRLPERLALLLAVCGMDASLRSTLCGELETDVLPSYTRLLGRMRMVLAGMDKALGEADKYQLHDGLSDESWSRDSAIDVNSPLKMV